MEELQVKYRTWYKGIKPKPIKLEIPGWAGIQNDHSNGDMPQPWHCLPFVEGSTYAFELIYPFDTECVVTRGLDSINFSGDFSQECVWNSGPPMSSFATGHYGMTSSLDLMPPEGYVTRIEPHPRFFTDETGTCPIAVPGHIQQWWGRIFFVVFKAPRIGEAHIFRKGEPYAQVLFVPAKNPAKLVEMTHQEQKERSEREEAISKYRTQIAKHTWLDYKNNPFDDKYKVLSGIYAKEGITGIERCLHIKKHKMPRKFIKSETLQTKKE